MKVASREKVSTVVALMMPAAVCSDKHCGTHVVAALALSSNRTDLYDDEMERARREFTGPDGTCNAHRHCDSESFCAFPGIGFEWNVCELCSGCTSAKSLSGGCPSKCDAALAIAATASTTPSTSTAQWTGPPHMASWGSFTDPGGPDGDPDVKRWRSWTSMPSATAEAAMGKIGDKL